MPYAKEIALAHRGGKFEYNAFLEISEMLKDPNLMSKTPYQYFAKALGKGRFPNNSKHAPAFLRALKGSDEEKAYAKSLLLQLSNDASGPLTQRMEKMHLKRLHEIREKDIAEKTRLSTSSAAKTVTEIANLNTRIERITDTKTENWVIERASVELIQQLDNLEIRKFDLAKKANATHYKLQLLLDQEPPKQSEIQRVRDELTKIDDEIEALSQELSPLRKEWIDYLTRTTSRYSALQYFSKRAGFDINKTTDLKVWLMDMATGQKDVNPKILKMTGVEADPKTGESKKVLKEIKISRLLFENEKEEMEAYSPGEIVVEYYDDDGKLTKSGYQNFLHLVDAFEAYEEIHTLAELNEAVAEENGFRDLKVGQEFKRKVLVDSQPIGSKGDRNYKEVSFKIQAIDEAKGEIILDQTVTKIPKELMGSTVPPALRFDRKQQKFSYGEFASLLRRKPPNTESEMSLDELQEALGKQKVKREKEAMDLVHGESPEIVDRFQKIGGAKFGSVTIPKAGETSKVFYLDDNGKRQAGIMRREIDENGKETLVIEPDEHAENKADTEKLMQMGMPMKMAARAAGLQTRKGTPPWTKRTRKLGAVAAMDAVNKGSIINRSAEPAPVPSGPSDPVTTLPVSPVEESPTPPTPPVPGAADDYSKEVLPYNDVHKVGDLATPETSFAKSLWAKTRFLSGSDIFEMGKVMLEYYNRRFERRQKDRYSSVGTDLPFFAPEMKRINQASETEAVNQFKEAFDQKGVFEIQGRLVDTTNRDEMKATFITLAEKGQIRWDDIGMWENLNQFVQVVDSSKMIPIPTNGNPYTQLSETDKRTGFDYLKGAVDSLWGEGQYDDWYSGNKSKYQSNARSFYEEGKELEGVDGGHTKRLGELLRQHKTGQYVNPQEYEGLILHSIEMGKSSMQAKIYYMVEGVAVKNEDGRTILPPDRIAHINSEMLPRFPILEYMTARFKRQNGAAPMRPTTADYLEWATLFDEGHPGDPSRFSPGAAVDRFMWQFVIPSDPTRTRINKAIRNGENLDHDDMFAYLPPATEEVLTDACKATSGSKKFLTIEGYANVFPGFSQYMRSLAENDKRERLSEAIRSYVRFESIMTDRYEKGQDKYQRMSQDTLNAKRGTVCTPGRPPAVFIKQMNDMVKEIIEAYNDPELNSIADIMYQDAELADKRKQDEINKALKDFSKVFKRVIKTDKGAKMLQITQATNLEGMPEGLSDAETAARKAAFTSANDLG